MTFTEIRIECYDSLLVNPVEEPRKSVRKRQQY